MKNYSDNPVENALLNDADVPLASFRTGDPGKNVKSIIPTPEWKAFSEMAEKKGVSLSLLIRIAMRQHLVWLKAYRSPAEIKMDQQIPTREALDHMMRIDESSLSTRLKNALKHEGFITIGDLENLSYFRFMMLPNIGKVSLAELQEFLGRNLTSAVFEEIPGEEFKSRQVRLRAWMAGN